LKRMRLRRLVPSERVVPRRIMANESSTICLS